MIFVQYLVRQHLRLISWGGMFNFLSDKLTKWQKLREMNHKRCFRLMEDLKKAKHLAWIKVVILPPVFVTDTSEDIIHIGLSCEEFSKIWVVWVAKNIEEIWCGIKLGLYSTIFNSVKPLRLNGPAQPKNHWCMMVLGKRLVGCDELLWSLTSNK